MFSSWVGCVTLYIFISTFKYINTSDVVKHLSKNESKLIQKSSTENCTIPTINNGTIAILKQSPSSLILNISCDGTYSIFPPNYNLAVCLNGIWDIEIPQCIKCGHRFKNIVKPLIVNGTCAKFGEFPWHVAIYQTKENKTEKQYICGGSIINEKSVLTAAHCFTDDSGKIFRSRKFYIAAGKYYSSYNHELDTYAQKRKIAKINIPSDYRGFLSNYAWDIAVLTVDEPFEISNIVQPVCIDWKTSFENEQLLGDNYGEIAGWGATETNLQTASAELRMLSVPFVNRTECLKHVPTEFNQQLTSDKICSGFLNGSSVCDGDSGGGLVFARIKNQETTYYIRGLVSLGIRSNVLCDSHKYSIYTRISSHIDFIQESISPQTTVTKTELFKKPTMPNTMIRNPLSHKNIRLLPSGRDCEHIKYTQENKITYSYPWLVLLFYIKNGEEMGFKCTGVLISKKYVLTAAHCTVGQIIEEFGDLAKVRVGKGISNDCINSYNERTCAYLNVEQIITHSDYVGLNRHNDIALLLIEIFDFNSHDFKVITKPLCLPINREKNIDEGSTFVYGWDNTNCEHNKWFQIINTANQQMCNQTEINLAQNQKCNIIRENICNVVEGGIIVNEYMKPGYGFYLKGIVSSRPRCNTFRSEIEYTRISDYILWILDTMKA